MVMVMSDVTQIEAYIQALANPDIMIRQAAKEALAGFGSDAVEPLLTAMKNHDERICWEAALVLAQIDDPRWIKPMQEAITSSNHVLGQVAVKALKNLNADMSDAFLQALPHCHYTVQVHIVVALENSRNKRVAIPLMRMLLHTTSSTLKHSIIQTLGSLDDPRSIHIIQLFQNDGDAHVRQQAQIALQHLETIASNDQNIC